MGCYTIFHELGGLLLTTYYALHYAEEVRQVSVESRFWCGKSSFTTLQEKNDVRENLEYSGIPDF